MREIVPITPHEGGVLKAEAILCREITIGECWNILLTQGIVFAAERRFGKSCIIRKMHLEGKGGFVTIYKQMQVIPNADKFVDELYESCKEYKLFDESIIKLIDNYWAEISKRIKSEIVSPTSAESHWRDKLRFLISKVIEKNEGKIFVIMLDEFSLMLDSLQPMEAAEIIGYLRDLVHESFPERLRFMYAGSIGLDLILSKIKKNNGKNPINIGDVVNHMKKYDVLPFSQTDAEYFCKCLALGCKIKIDIGIINEIYTLTEGIPFYIDKIFGKLRYKAIIDKSLVREIYYDLLQDDKNDTNLRHFYDRIKDYYIDKELATEILNFLSHKSDYQVESEIIDKVTSILERSSPSINEKLSKLWQDGYLDRKYEDEKRHYKFKYNIIKNWWKINKA